MKDKKVAHPISTQLTGVFALILMATIVIAWIANFLFLGDYYTSKKKNTLKTFYQTLSNAYSSGTLDTEEFDNYIHHLINRNNIDGILVDANYSLYKIYSADPEKLILSELERRRTGKDKLDDVLEQTEDYMIVVSEDTILSLQYIEIWGQLSDGVIVICRTPIESIDESAQLALRMYSYVGFVCALLGSLVVYFISRRVSKPVLNLADISEKVAEMDFEAKYEGKYDNEIGLLGRNINTMSSNLENAITELKKANIELQKDIENKNKIDEMRKEFVSNVSHELKTPIALIQGYAEGLKEIVNEEADRDYYCDVIIDESARMNQLVRKLLTLNQLEFGGYDVSIERFNITSMVKNIIQSSELFTTQDGILTSCPDEEIYVWADEYMIEEVIQNFMSNALHHCKSNTEKRIDVSFKMQENVLEVSVFNTGDHIPEASIEHIWDKFYKVDKARTREYGGSGVGLSIVRAIIEAHKQKYGVENVEGGVRFWFTIDSDCSCDKCKTCTEEE